jgi:Domain of unknown function (DUF4936)
VSSRRLFIYFRVERDSVADVVAAVRELQAAWQRDGVRCELMRRVDESGDVTLMETYACAQGVSADWQDRIEREAAARLSRWPIGQRHVEVFEPCA